MMIEGTTSAAAGDSSMPSRMRRTRVETSRTSAARALRYSSSRDSSMAAIVSAVSCNAASALMPCSLIADCTAACSSGSSSIILCASNIAASPLPLSCRAISWISSNCAPATVTASKKRRHSSSLSATGQRSIFSSCRLNWNSGPIAIPRDAAIPCSSCMIPTSNLTSGSQPLPVSGRLLAVGCQPPASPKLPCTNSCKASSA